MRGRPIFLTACMAALFALAAWPVGKLTGAAVVRSREEPVPAHADRVDGWLTIRWAHEPKSLVITDAHGKIWQKAAGDASPVEAPVSFSVDDGRAEWSIVGAWSTDTALTVTVEPDGRAARSQTFWTQDARVDDVASFAWREKP